MQQEQDQVLLRDYRPRSLLNLPAHVPVRARFPVIDAHNHLFGDVSAEELLKVMDQVGVHTFVNVTGNARFPFTNGGYAIEECDFGLFKRDFVDAYPGRFEALTMSDFAGVNGSALFARNDSVEGFIANLEAHLDQGACGLKVTKELGLGFRDRDGCMVPVDDERLFPVWRRAGQLGVPVLIHTSDPEAFFLPIDETNEHYANLLAFPRWSFQDAHFSKKELLAQRNRVVASHPNTTFILPHVANHPEDLASVAALMDAHPNVVIDFSARIDELGRQPYTARDFMIAYQDRILFGTDMPVSPEIYRCHFRFLETRDEWFAYPDYDGGWGRARWGICGLHLPDVVLKKIYHLNAERILPGVAVS